MSVKKQPILRQRIRRPPREGWSWIDRRFLREHADSLSREAILLYFFLAAVSDKDGLSFYSDLVIESRLRLDKAALLRARADLVARDLLAYQPPLYQVLSLPERRVESAGSAEPAAVGDIMQELARRYCQKRGEAL